MKDDGGESSEATLEATLIIKCPSDVSKLRVIAEHYSQNHFSGVSSQQVDGESASAQQQWVTSETAEVDAMAVDFEVPAHIQIIDAIPS